MQPLYFKWKNHNSLTVYKGYLSQKPQLWAVSSDLFKYTGKMLHQYYLYPKSKVGSSALAMHQKYGQPFFPNQKFLDML